MMIEVNLCVIGAGTGGLVVAGGTARFGLRTVLIEHGAMGGECLNTGCVPSKALLAAAKRAHQFRKSDISGIGSRNPEIDFAGVKDYVRAAIAAIAPHDSAARFEGMGVTVLRERARFMNPSTVETESHTIRARHFVVATGSRPAMPPIPGLETVPVLTNETIFDVREEPDHLLIVGGGPIGVEMAQAHRRLGCRVTVFDRGSILPRDDAACVAVVRNALLAEGVEVLESADVASVAGRAGEIVVSIDKGGERSTIIGSHLLIATGRQATTDGLGLEAAGIVTNEDGIVTDARLRTTNQHVFAVGDAVGGPRFTHVAEYQAGIVVRNICFKLPASVNYRSLPWVTYSEPELAQAGPTEAAARKHVGSSVRVVEWRFADVDRAVTESATHGLIRVVTTRTGRILGASIVGAHAGELIDLWVLAIAKRMRISSIANMMTPYPTLGEVSKRAAGDWLDPYLFNSTTKRVVGLLQHLPW